MGREQTENGDDDLMLSFPSLPLLSTLLLLTLKYPLSRTGSATPSKEEDE